MLGKEAYHLESECDSQRGHDTKHAQCAHPPSAPNKDGRISAQERLEPALSSECCRFWGGDSCAAVSFDSIYSSQAKATNLTTMYNTSDELRLVARSSDERRRC
jgi:hypothetical protein